jgi:hypothetical protein
MSIRVTVLDTESGETHTAEIENDYILVCAGNFELVNTMAYPTKGTVVLTVKGFRRLSATPRDPRKGRLKL